MTAPVQPQPPPGPPGERTLVLLNIDHIDAQTATDTVNILLKYRSDIAKAVKEFSTNAGTFDKKG